MEPTNSQKKVIAQLAKNFKVDVSTVRISHIPAHKGCSDKNLVAYFPADGYEKSFLMTKNGRIIR